MSIFDLASYKKPVVIEGTRPASDVAETLARMTRPPKNFLPQARRPFVGRVAGLAGRICYYPSYWKNAGRSLVFTLEPTEGGCRLSGRLELNRFVRGFSWFYSGFCVADSIFMLVSEVIHRTLSLRGIASDVLFPLLFGLVFMYGYNGSVVLVSRRTERQAITVIRHVMKDENAEEFLLELLK